MARWWVSERLSQALSASTICSTATHSHMNAATKVNAVLVNAVPTERRYGVMAGQALWTQHLISSVIGEVSSREGGTARERY